MPPPLTPGGADPYAVLNDLIAALGSDVQRERTILAEDVAQTEAQLAELQSAVRRAEARIGTAGVPLLGGRGPAIEAEALAASRGATTGGVVLPPSRYSTRSSQDQVEMQMRRFGGGATAGSTRQASQMATAERELAAAEEQVALRSRTAGASIGRLSSEEAAAAAMTQRAAFQMQRFGALSSEAITRIGRGNATLRELAYQTGITTAKFGGWLVAGGAIYTALGAIRELGTGAIDSASGVNQLQRVVSNVNTDDAKREFRSLSEEFNLPISTVTDAAYQMGKVFHDQNDALKASRSILYAVKVGELDTATASRYLTAIINGFNLSADQQAVVFDQLNQAQNKYNISISSVMAGTAKAAAAFHLAGGDVTDLIALITTLSKATGQTGDVIGTAIQRSPHFMAMQQNQEVLRGFGVDPERSIQQVYQQAIEIAKKLAPDKQRQLAEALFGPQYGARVGVSLLAHGDLLSQVMKTVSPGEAAGSAKRELQTTLGAFSERLTMIGTQLGALGSNLEQAGFFDLLKLGVGTLLEMLRVVNTLFEAFNRIPRPLRDALTIALQLYGIFRVLRFFNLGQMFSPESRMGQFFTPPDMQQRQTREILAGQQTDLAGEQGNAIRQRQRLMTQRMSLEQDAQAAERAYNSAVLTGVGKQEELQGSVRTAKMRVLANERSLAQVDQTQANILQQQLMVAEQRRILKQNPRMTDAQMRAFGGAFGMPIPSGVVPEASLPPEVTRQLEEAGINIAPSQSLMQRARTQIGTLQSRWQSLSRDLGGFGAIGYGIRRGVGMLSTGADRAITGIRNMNMEQLGSIGGRLTTAMRSGAGRVRAAASGVIAAIGPINLAIFAAFALLDAWSQASQAGQELAQTMEQGNTAESSQEMLDASEQLRSQVESSPLNNPSINPLQGYEDIFGLVQGQYGQMGDALDEAARLQGQVMSAKAQLIAGYPVTPTDQPAVDEDLLRDSFKIVTDGVREGNLGAQDIKRRLHNFITEAKAAKSRVQDVPGLIAEFRAQMAEAADASGKALNSMLFTTPEALEQFQQRMQIKASPFGAAARKLYPGSSPQELSQAVQAFEGMPDTISGAARSQLEQDLALANTQRERNKAYREFIDSLEHSPFLKQLRSQEGDLNDQLRRAQETLKFWQNTAGVYRDRGDQMPAEARKSLDAAKKRTDSIKNRLDAINDIDRETHRSLQSIAQEEGRQARYESQTQAFEATTKIGIAGRTDPIAKARYQLERTRKELQKAIDFYGKDTTKYADLIAQEKDQEDELFQARIERINSQVQLRAARLGSDTLAGLRELLDGARRVMGRMIDRYGRNSQKTIEAMQQEQEAEDSLLEERLSMIQGRAELQAARLGEGPQATAVLLASVQQQMQIVAERWGTGNSRYLDLLKQQIDLRDQAFQDQIAIVQAQAGLAAARADTPVQEARATLEGAIRVLQLTQANPRASQQELLEAARAVAESRDQLQQAIEEQAQGIRDAAFALATAKAAEDPVRQARIALRQALYHLRIADTRQERLQARTEAVQARQQIRQSIFQRELEDIQFQADIGKLTLDQQIAAYRHLLHTLDLTRDMRRELRRQIYQLKQEAEGQAGDFELRVGDIRLPTIYDVRRAMQGGINQAPNFNVTNQPTINIYPSGPGAMGAVSSALDKTLGTSTRAAMRSAGLN